MSTYLSDAVQASLDTARRQVTCSVRTAAGEVPVLRLWEDGFAIAATDAPRLRGFVDVYEGVSHLCRCLVVPGAVQGEEMLFEFKRVTAATDRAPRDYAPPEEPPSDQRQA